MTFSIGNAQIDPSDDFEGNGNITWKADNNEMNTSFDNPAPGGINTSAKVLEYSDEGGTYSNIQFDLSTNTNVKYDLTTKNVFTLKVFVPTPTVAVTLGAKMIEKHFILHKDIGGPDADFSLDVTEFTEMVTKVRQAEKLLGKVSRNGSDCISSLHCASIST